MYISYFDETGDDGFPKYSSEIFVLSSVYLHHQNWKTIYSKIRGFRKNLKIKFNLPVKTEIHTKKLLLNKEPFRQFNWPENKRLEIIKEMAEFVSAIDIKNINVCIFKKKIITSKQIEFYKNILDKALSFNIQRIENSIKRVDPIAKFMIVTDEGRVGSMRRTARKIQKINFIPSKYNLSSYRQEINLLIEDPLAKDSKDSYFIQLSDFISYLVYLKLIGRSKWHGRLNWFQEKDLDEIIEMLKPIFNLEASKNNEYGFVCYPK